MGGGLLSPRAHFGISEVEAVSAHYADYGGARTEAFISVRSTTTLPGAAQSENEVSTWRVSAVAIDRSNVADAVFHRQVIPLP